MSTRKTTKQAAINDAGKPKEAKYANGVLEKRLLKALLALAKEAYPTADLSSLTVEFSHEDYRTMHGDYNSGLKRIRITNLYRTKLQLLCCAIHELAHALQDAMDMPLGHKKDFYVFFYNLLQSACKMGMLDRKDLQEGFNDERSLGKVIRMIGPITMLPDAPNKIYGAGIKLIVAFNAYDCKDILKKRGYFFNPRSKAWEMEIPEEIADEELYYISGLGADAMVTDLLDITIFSDVVVTGNTYKYRQELARNKFHFDRSARRWMKRVPSTDEPQSDPFIIRLKQLNDITVTISY